MQVLKMALFQDMSWQKKDMFPILDIVQQHIDLCKDSDVSDSEYTKGGKIMKKTNCRCTDCGFIRYNTTKMEVCPICGNRNIKKMVPAFTNKQEALNLFCDAFKISPTSRDGMRIKQALDIIMGQGC